MGREQALADLATALRRRALVEIVGPPGVGKTRLALELARRTTPTTVRFCDLTEATSTGAFLLQVARAVGATVPLDVSEDELAARIGERIGKDTAALLVLDNFEQLPQAADARLAAWFDHETPRVVVTTRRRLAGAPSSVVTLHPLSTDRRPGERWSEAAELLAARAEAITGEAFDSEPEREAIEQLATQLDGLPLAIELAAARLRLLAPPQVLARLSDRFRVLRRPDGALGRPDLRESIGGSFALLSPEEQRALIATSVFRGGFTLDAAEAVLVEEGAPWALDLLESLLDHSVLTVDGDPEERRYGLLLSIRAFVEEEAAAHPPSILEGASMRHAEHYATLGEKLLARADASSRRALHRERENLLAVVDRRARVGSALALRAALVLTAPASGLPYTTAEEVLGAALEMPANEALALRGRASLQRGTVRRFLGRIEAAEADLRAACAVAEEASDRGLLAEALAGLGNTAAVSADWKTVRDYLVRALDAHPAPEFRARGLAMVANTFCNEDDHDRAEVLFREAVSTADRCGDEAGAALSRLALGVMLLEVGQLEEAHAYLSDALEAYRRLGSLHWEGLTLSYLARWKQEMGDLPAAIALYPEALQHIEMAGVRRAQAVAWYHFATALIEAGELGAAAERLREALPLVRATCPDHEGMILAAQGIIAARRGAADDAALLLRRAEESLLRYTRPMFLAAVRVLAGAEPPPEHAACSEVRLALRLRVPIAPARAVPPLLVAKDGSWFRPPSASTSIALDRRKAIRGVLGALAQQRRDRPGEAASLSMLVEAGWPGERIVAGAGAERVYAAVATLRRLGLRGVILQKGEGYLLSPEIPLVLG
ncbi:Signal transduction response regulator [Minicystis rosea]|nr:Signal transduction response regulator [Minicystis rosea]